MKWRKQIILVCMIIGVFLAGNVASSDRILGTNSGKTLTEQVITAIHPYPPLPPNTVDIAYDDNEDHGWGYNLQKTLMYNISESCLHHHLKQMEDLSERLELVFSLGTLSSFI